MIMKRAKIKKKKDRETERERGSSTLALLQNYKALSFPFFFFINRIYIYSTLSQSFSPPRPLSLYKNIYIYSRLYILCTLLSSSLLLMLMLCVHCTSHVLHVSLYLHYILHLCTLAHALSSFFFPSIHIYIYIYYVRARSNSRLPKSRSVGLDPIISCPLSGSACYAIGLPSGERWAVCFVSLIAERRSPVVLSLRTLSPIFASFYMYIYFSDANSLIFFLLYSTHIFVSLIVSRPLLRRRRRRRRRRCTIAPLTPVCRTPFYF